MQVESIDNVNEDDGLVLVTSQLAKLATPGADRRLVAIVPEYKPDGTLDRLDIVTMAKGDPNISVGVDSLEGLRCYAGAVALEEQQAREAAYAKLQEPTVVEKPPA
jgi:hypothetical protein